MLWFFGQSLLFVVLAFLLGLLVGWLIWGRRPQSSSATPGATRSEARPAPEPVAATSKAKPDATSEAEAKSEPVAVATTPEPEPAVEAEPVAEPVVAAEPMNEVTEPVAEPVAEPVVAAEPEAENEAVAEPVAVADSEPAAADEPTAVDEPVAVAEAEPVAETGPVAETEHEVEAEPVAEPAAVDEPVAVAEPVATQAPVPVAAGGDNLQRLEGIGPKIATVLTAAGIRTYGQLAATDQATLSATLRKGGLRVGPTVSTWTKQAELLARGDEAGFTALAGQLATSRRGR